MIHGFAPPGLAFNHRGWGQFHTHSIFTRRPQGEPASFSICRSPYADRRTVTASGRPFFGPVRDRQNFSASQQKFRERFTTERLGSVSAGRCRARGTPDEEPAPSVGGSVLAAPGTTPGAASRWLQIGCMAKRQAQSQGYCCSKSSVRFRFSVRREIALTVRGDTSFCSTRGAKDNCDD